MSAETFFEPEQILRVLNARGVRYVVVGGLAVAAHGVVRATADLDLVVDRSWENAAALEQALRELGARDLDGGEAAIGQEALVRRADRRLLTRNGEVHLLHEVGGVPDYEGLQPAAEFEIDGVKFAVASLAALRRMKQAADRAKDRIDLAELDALDGPEEPPPPS